MIPIDLIEDYLVDQEEGLKKLLTWFLNLVMQLEAMDQIEAEPYERADSRKAHRNGYKARTLKTRVGELNLKKPQFREIPFQTKVFDRYSRIEKALINAIVESYLQGVSTRRVQDIVSRLGIEDLSASSVSRIARELDEKVDEFLKRPIEHPISYLFVDAGYFKVRTNSRYVTNAFLIVAGIRDDGYREILGARIADGEDELFWSGLFQDLKDRGLSGVQLVISDGHKGIQKAVEKSFLGASWQMCHVHPVRAVLRNVAKKYHKEIAGKLKAGLEDENKMHELIQELESRGYSKAADTIERFQFSLWNYRTFPTSHQRRSRTTNGLEEADIKEPAILIRINQLYRYGMDADQLYDATRGVWVIGPRREHAVYAFSVFKGIVMEVYKIKHPWYLAGTKSTTYKTRPNCNELWTSDPKRWEFEGEVAESEIRDKYLKKSVKRYLSNGSQNPIKYVNC